MMEPVENLCEGLEL